MLAAIVFAGLAAIGAALYAPTADVVSVRPTARAYVSPCEGVVR